MTDERLEQIEDIINAAFPWSVADEYARWQFIHYGGEGAFCELIDEIKRLRAELARYRTPYLEHISVHGNNCNCKECTTWDGET